MATEPEQSILDLTARTATADSDLLHINSGGTDYKETKADFLMGTFYREFANTSAVTSQIDALPAQGTWFGRIAGYGKQTETGLPINANGNLQVRKYNANYVEADFFPVSATEDEQYRITKVNGTWGSWSKIPQRSEITSLNSNLSNSKLHYKEHYFSNVTLPASTLYVNLGDIQTNFGIPSGSYYVSFFIRGWSGTGTSVISLVVASNDKDLYLMGSQAFTGGAFTVRCWYVATN